MDNTTVNQTAKSATDRGGLIKVWLLLHLEIQCGTGDIKLHSLKKKSTPTFRKLNISYLLIRRRVYVSRGKKCLFFQKIWRALFSWYLPFWDWPFYIITDKLNISKPFHLTHFSANMSIYFFPKVLFWIHFKPFWSMDLGLNICLTYSFVVMIEMTLIFQFSSMYLERIHLISKFQFRELFFEREKKN